MCGILGTVNCPLETELLDLIAHRGPDDSGSCEVAVGAHSVTLRHRRLAIVDLSPSGHQPVQLAGDAFSIVFNGEIYNHTELREGMRNVSFRGHSDTETILHAMARRGIEAVRDFNGIFAFAFLDRPKQKLYLARDPFGVKPLYYAQTGKGLIFCSELKPIQKQIKDRIDPAHLADLLCLRYSPAPDTLFQTIKKVRPGHVVEIDLSQPALSLREFAYLRPTENNLGIRYDDAVREYGRLFESAIRRQLMSDVEIGILLSGGVDSAMVAALAQRHSRYRMKAFTVGFDGRGDCDEIADAAETAATLGLEHHTVRIGFDDFLGMLRQCVTVVEEPLATTSLIPMYSLAGLAARHVKVVLTGQGADEPLGGYGRYQGELWHERIPVALAALLRPVAVRAGLRNDQMLRGLSALAQGDDVARFISAYSVFAPEDIEQLTGIRSQSAGERISYFYELLGCRERRRSVERMMAIDLRMNLADDLLLYTDKITMRHSLECRVPILDLELVRFIESLPAHYRVRFRQGKVIHKDFARELLPESIVNRPKKGFQSPTKTWFRSKAVHDMLQDPASSFARQINLSAVERILIEHQNGYNRERHIFLLLNLYFWMSEYS